MKNWPLISIVTPNFNGDKYLEETILSVIGQEYPNLEYIVIDGGSTDNSLNIIKKYEDKISYWVSEPDSGLYGAIQKGFDLSKGEIMAWINSDDMYHRKALFTVAEIFSSFQNINWLQGNPTTFDEYGRTVNCDDIKRWSKYNFYMYNYKWVQQESVFWRRSLWEKAGNKIDDSLKLAGDLDLWLRFFRYDKLYITKALIGGFRQRSKGQLSLEFMDDYIIEAELKIKAEDKSNYDKTVILSYNILTRFDNFLKKSRFFNLNSLINYFENKYFLYPPIVYFDRKNQKFVI